MSDRYNVYIDGFNLYKGALERRPDCKWLDLISFSRALTPSGNLGKVYYFTAGVKSRFKNDRASDRQHNYLRVLEHSGVEVVLGKFSKSEKWRRVVSKDREELIQPPIRPFFGITQLLINESWSASKPDVPKAQMYQFEEKGSDVNLASYLLRDSFSKVIDVAYVVTGDSDLKSPIQFANDSGIIVNVIVPSNGQNMNSLKSVASSLVPLDVGTLRSHQFPKVYITPKGRKIHRPISWN